MSTHQLTEAAAATEGRMKRIALPFCAVNNVGGGAGYNPKLKKNYIFDIEQKKKKLASAKNTNTHTHYSLPKDIKGPWPSKLLKMLDIEQMHSQILLLFSRCSWVDNLYFKSELKRSAFGAS